MLKTVRLKVLPTVTNCLSWSHEGALAVVAGENVMILVPRCFTPDGSTKSKQQFWISRANMRQLIIDSMDDEIAPAEAKLYSIGEEQGPGYAKQVSWSPLGASRYRRCLLAVVSTNHRLYIFEPVGHVGGDMRLVHDLTPLICDYDGLPIREGEELDDVARKRLRARCRSMTWSPPCRIDGNRWGVSFMAAGNDFLEIVFLRVTFDRKEVVGHIAPFTEKDVVGWLGKRVTHIQLLRWSPWVRCKDGKHWAFLAYVWNGKVWVSRVAFDMKDSTAPKATVVGDPVVVGGAISERHPVFAVAFAPEEIGGKIVLAFSAQMCSTVVTFDIFGQLLCKEDFKNDFIEVVSGLSFAPSDTPNTIVIQVLSVQGKSQSITYTVPFASSTAPTSTSIVHSSGDILMLDAPTDEELRSFSSTWPAILAEMKQDFMAEFEIPTAITRGYGLAVSPIGGITAIAASFHPKDSLEYITGSNEKMVIVFATAPGSSGSWKNFEFSADGALPNPITISTETVLLEAMALGESFTSRVHAAISATAVDNPNLDTISYLEGEDMKEFLAKHTLLDAPLNSQRYSVALKILEHPRNQPLELLPENPHIIAAPIATALSAPRSLSEDFESKRILYSMACVGIMGFYSSPTILSLAKDVFEWLDVNTPPETRFDLELEIIGMRARAANGEEKETEMNVENGFVSSLEKCKICNEGVVWRDLRIAECTSGHRFSRCALTFLPITDPKETRECAVCARTVLGGHAKGKTWAGLVEAIWGGWEVCMLCGGRYWAEGS
ncbi:transcription factor IIIC subunit delta N-term-domain-containing protein [Trichophaea hybrida]|nr:transcription factor IIIC subunit delta N-term-domain-containing protein [Trichophaea hybrida]